MTLQTTPRRHDQPIQIGPRHGYRIEGDHVFINAELQVPLYRSGGEWKLELWAAERPHREGPLTGVKVAELALELPTPIGPYVHQVDTRTTARLPLQGRAYPMVLALIQHAPDGRPSVHAFANYAQPQTFSGPHFGSNANVGYRVQGQEVVLEADGIFNPRPGDNLSGTLSLELWAFPVGGAPTEGLRLAVSEIGTVSGQCQLMAIQRRVAFTQPPVGRFQLALVLNEWTLAHGYVARDRRDFSLPYEHAAPALSVSSSPAAPAVVAAPAVAAPAPAVVAAPVGLRLVPTVQPEAAAEAPLPAAPGLVSIQTASVEALAGIKGLNLKIAKEIIKARPFTSLADLIRVRGLGQKTIDRVKGLLTI